MSKLKTTYRGSVIVVGAGVAYAAWDIRPIYYKSPWQRVKYILGALGAVVTVAPTWPVSVPLLLHVISKAMDDGTNDNGIHEVHANSRAYYWEAGIRH